MAFGATSGRSARTVIKLARPSSRHNYRSRAGTSKSAIVPLPTASSTGGFTTRIDLRCAATPCAKSAARSRRANAFASTSGRKSAPICGSDPRPALETGYSETQKVGDHHVKPIPQFETGSVSHSCNSRPCPAPMYRWTSLRPTDDGLRRGFYRRPYGRLYTWSPCDCSEPLHWSGAYGVVQ
jgi:hypothetical protein